MPVGWRWHLLAIIDLDERSNQPLRFGHLHLVFNGKIYNYLGTARRTAGSRTSLRDSGSGESSLLGGAR